MLSSNVAPILKYWKLVGVTLMVLVVGVLGNLAAGATPAEAAATLDVGPGRHSQQSKPHTPPRHLEAPSQSVKVVVISRVFNRLLMRLLQAIRSRLGLRHFMA